MTSSLRRGLLLAPTVLLSPGVRADHPLRISYNDDYAPYSFVAHPGRPVEGVLPQALQLVFSAVQPKVQIQHLAWPWRRAQAMVENGGADALCTFASDERRRYATFNRLPVVTLEPHLFFSAKHPRRHELERVQDRETLKAFRLVDQRGNQWAEQQFAGFPRVDWASGHDAIYRMVLAEHGDVHVALSPLVTRWRLRKLGLQQEILSVPAPYVAPAVPFHLGIRSSHPNAEIWLAQLDERLQSPLIRQRIQAIERSFG